MGMYPNVVEIQTDLVSGIDFDGVGALRQPHPLDCAWGTLPRAQSPIAIVSSPTAGH